MMLTTLIALAAAATPTGAVPQATPQATPVAGPTAEELSAWVAQVDRQIDAHLAQPDFGDSGIATVTFRRGMDGRPVEISAQSNSPFVRRAAIRTIKGAGVLPPMPASVPANQRVTFRFLVGMVGHQDEYDAARRTLIAGEKRANVALAAQLASKVQVAALPGPKVELAALERR